MALEGGEDPHLVGNNFSILYALLYTSVNNLANIHCRILTI